MKVLRTADFAPLMVFIAPTNTATQVLRNIWFKRLAHQLKLANGLLPVSQTENLQMIQKESEAILSTYRQYFDVVLINNDVNESVKIVEEALERATTTPQWVPVSWVY